MPLTECPDCGHQVSTSAAACPQCGHPFETQSAGTAEFHARTPLIFALIGAGTVIVGSLLPWVSVTPIFGTLSVNGTEGDGVLTLIAGAFAGVVAGAALGRKSVSGVTSTLLILLGAGSGFVAYVSFSVVSDAASMAEQGVLSSVGVGLWLVIVGSATIVGAGVATLSYIGDKTPSGAGAWSGIAVGVGVALLLVVVATFAYQQQGDVVSETFSDIADSLESP